MVFINLMIRQTFNLTYRESRSPVEQTIHDNVNVVWICGMQRECSNENSLLSDVTRRLTWPVYSLVIYCDTSSILPPYFLYNYRVHQCGIIALDGLSMFCSSLYFF